MELWTEDEHRVGLQPIIRGIWTEKGSHTVTVPVCPGYDWFYLFAFVHPSSGRTYWWILPYCNIAMFSIALEDFAQEFGANKGKQIVLMIDKAPWHTSQRLEIPDGIHFVELPAKSPELQPAERLWELSDEVLANKAWKDIEIMKDMVWERCNELTKQTEVISSLTNYHWWPEDIIVMD